MTWPHLHAGFPKNQATFARVSGYCEQTGKQSPTGTTASASVALSAPHPRLCKNLVLVIGWLPNACRVVRVIHLPLPCPPLPPERAADYHSPYATVHESLQFRWAVLLHGPQCMHA